jgi:hypothetical protein
MISVDPGVWVGVILLLMTWSFLYKNTFVYRVVENMFVGVGAGYVTIVAIKTILTTAWTPIYEQGRLVIIVPFVIGLLLYVRFVPGLACARALSKWGIAVIVGVVTGLFVRSIVEVNIIQQILSTAAPFATVKAPLDIFNAVLVLTVVVCTLLYFLFSREQKGVLGYVSKFGRYAMMVNFGAIFGGTVIARFANVIDRLQFLLFQWLGLG